MHTSAQIGPIVCSGRWPVWNTSALMYFSLSERERQSLSLSKPWKYTSSYVSLYFFLCVLVFDSDEPTDTPSHPEPDSNERNKTSSTNNSITNRPTSSEHRACETPTRIPAPSPPPRLPGFQAWSKCSFIRTWSCLRERGNMKWLPHVALIPRVLESERSAAEAGAYKYQGEHTRVALKRIHDTSSLRLKLLFCSILLVGKTCSTPAIYKVNSANL